MAELEVCLVRTCNDSITFNSNEKYSAARLKAPVLRECVTDFRDVYPEELALPEWATFFAATSALLCGEKAQGAKIVRTRDWLRCEVAIIRS